MSERDRDAAAYLLHPVVLAALVLWLANDHVGKAAYPGWLSGKASDIASLVVFPLVPIAALDLWRARAGKPGPGAGWILGWALATGAVMATINLFDWAATAYRWGLGAAQWPLRVVYESMLGHGVPALHPVRLTMDPTDLCTLPALLVPLALALGAGSSLQGRVLDVNPNRPARS
jgi:hypothetical protein